MFAEGHPYSPLPINWLWDGFASGCNWPYLGVPIGWILLIEEVPITVSDV